MRVHVEHTLGDLVAILSAAPEKLVTEGSQIIRRNIEAGNKVGRAFAKTSSGVHGKHYPKAFSAQMTSALEGEWGPDEAKPQGGMSFERGSRNQKPHLDVLRSGDVQVPQYHDDMSDLADRLLW